SQPRGIATARKNHRSTKENAMNNLAAWAAMAMLALETVCLIAIAAVIARRVSSAFWQRTIWQACFVSLAGLLALEATGGARSILSYAAGRYPAHADCGKTSPDPRKP